MEVLYRHCCGLDVHKTFIIGCLIVMGADGQRHKELQRFGTMTAQLLELVDWLHACRHGIHRRVLETGLQRVGRTL
jgi:hypothetical protein